MVEPGKACIRHGRKGTPNSQIPSKNNDLSSGKEVVDEDKPRAEGGRLGKKNYALSESITLCHDWMLVDGKGWERPLPVCTTTIALTISLSSGAYYHTHFARKDTNVEMPKPAAHFEKHGLRLRLHCFPPPSTLE